MSRPRAPRGSTTLSDLRRDLRKLADPEGARVSRSFFKVGKGEYGEGDRFLGLTAAQLHALAKAYESLSLQDLTRLLASRVHEHRLVALLMLVRKYRRAVAKERRELVRFYLDHLDHVNNWDLVDASAPQILGDWLLDKETTKLDVLARSKVLWRRRIAIVATHAFIRRRRCDEALRIAEMLLDDEHDLIHKAVGWMLREVGKHCGEPILRRFLDRNVRRMPRTTLRYAIERLPEDLRQKYLGARARRR